jgi:hypothetical protein
MKSKRMTVEFSSETFSRLEELKSELGLGSIVDVLRLAVQVLSYLQRERKAGYELILRKDDASGTREKEPILTLTGK